MIPVEPFSPPCGWVYGGERVCKNILGHLWGYVNGGTRPPYGQARKARKAGKAVQRGADAPPSAAQRLSLIALSISRFWVWRFKVSRLS